MANRAELGRNPELNSINNGDFSKFFNSGIYRLEESNSVFVDPVRVINRSYTSSRVSPHSYYTRFFEPNHTETTQRMRCSGSGKRKRSMENRKPRDLNEKERMGDLRHQEARPLLLKACDPLLGAKELLGVMRDLRDGSGSSVLKAGESSLLELGGVWQSSLCEITLGFCQSDETSENGVALPKQ